MMAASMPGPLSFNSQIPVTPPPDHQIFMKGLFPPSAFQQPSHHNHNHQHNQSQYRGGIGLGVGLSHEPTPSNSTAASCPHISEHPTTTTTSPRPPSRSMQPPQLRTTTISSSSSSSIPPSATSPGFPPNFKSQPGFPPVGIDPTTAATAALNPAYIAMASRIASHYQQRCQAVANFQQQRCQQWAAAQRAKCQEMTQAAMLVVAWYIRDRINRRRKRQKRSFKRALTTKERSKSKVTKGERVRRWVMGVPLGEKDEGGGREVPMDEAERDFDMDDQEQQREGDKDGKLFEVADGLIKSQLARIEVPLLGVLGFDESDSEEESESESEVEYEEGECEDEFDEEEEEEEEYEDEEEYEEEEEVVGDTKGKGEETTMGSLSKDAQLGTDRRKGSRDSSVL